ncbi:MAG: YHS domain-containing protein [Proteobacteria bacterium]|nr:YHS domain-containing protein [Pseudomonadota bacterium]
MRFLILIALAFLLYHVIRKYLRLGQKSVQRADGGPVDEMVQDPSCLTYIPRRGAQRKVIGGKEFFFCSNDCAEKFEKERRR